MATLIHPYREGYCYKCQQKPRLITLGAWEICAGCTFRFFEEGARKIALKRSQLCQARCKMNLNSYRMGRPLFADLEQKPDPDPYVFLDMAASSVLIAEEGECPFCPKTLVTTYESHGGVWRPVKKIQKVLILKADPPFETPACICKQCLLEVVQQAGWMARIKKGELLEKPPSFEKLLLHGSGPEMAAAASLGDTPFNPLSYVKQKLAGSAASAGAAGSAGSAGSAASAAGAPGVENALALGSMLRPDLVSEEEDDFSEISMGDLSEREETNPPSGQAWEAPVYPCHFGPRIAVEA